MRSSEVSLKAAVRLTHDRRRERLLLSACRTCGHTAPVVVSRTEYVVYVRCGVCASVWSLAKPGETFG
jgi:ribosomal protein S27E